MPYITDSLSNATVSYSKNLRGIIAHGGKCGVNVITVVPYVATDLAQGYKVTFYFCERNGYRTQATTHFADWRALLQQNILGRSRNLVPNRLTVSQAIYDAMRAEGYTSRVIAKGSVLTIKQEA